MLKSLEPAKQAWKNQPEFLSGKNALRFSLSPCVGEPERNDTLEETS